MPPREDPSTDDTLPTIHEQLSTLIAISTANLHRLDAILTQMTAVNTLIGIQTGTMSKLIPPPPPLPPSDQQQRPPPPAPPPSPIQLKRRPSLPPSPNEPLPQPPLTTTSGHILHLKHLFQLFDQ
ncbi:unnamed protein product [Lactuca virosa]|uniref:Uncharacterized protein n=1 Tax=Lactuca virosa TaxID=75947 RepID=A0AAU9MCP3_9ASTR|nr:unnamed protein product [Lactuca virosa]